MGQRTIIIGIIAIVIAGFLGLIFLIRGLARPAQSPRETVNTAVNENVIPVNQIVTDPYVYDGLRVEVEAKITDWVNKRAFTIGNAGGFLGAPGGELLIIREDAYRLPKDTEDPNVALGDTDTVHVKGRVRVMTREEVQRALGLDFEDDQENRWDDRIEFDDNRIYGWDKRVVILASSVQKPQ
jgi:hypothetical protein